MVLSPYMQIWHPWIFGVQDERERAGLVARVSTYAMVSVSATSLFVILFGRQAAILLAGKPEFYEAYKVIPYIAGGYVFWGLYHVSQMPLLIAKRTTRLFFINLVAVAVNLGLNAWLIPRHGFVGAGVATLLSFMVLSGLGMAASHSMAHVPFELTRLTETVVCVLSGGALALWIDGLNAAGRVPDWAAVAAKATALALLLGALWGLVMTADERRRAKGWLTARAWRGAH
jgi:O-antigen/teichoic acid export membrane protein